jgi:hypothetical protein
MWVKQQGVSVVQTSERMLDSSDGRTEALRKLLVAGRMAQFCDRSGELTAHVKIERFEEVTGHELLSLTVRTCAIRR